MSFLDTVVSFYYVLLMFLPFGFVFGFLWLVARFINAAWLARLRSLLEEQGLRVREMKRVWIKTAFPGEKPLARSEWLARVVVEDREGQVRSGWVRWHRLRPWDKADRWAVEWDDHGR
jgi:hypothetical protein